MYWHQFLLTMLKFIWLKATFLPKLDEKTMIGNLTSILCRKSTLLYPLF